MICLWNVEIVSATGVSDSVIRCPRSSANPFPFLSSISLDVELRAILRVLVNSI